MCEISESGMQTPHTVQVTHYNEIMQCSDINCELGYEDF